MPVTYELMRRVVGVAERSVKPNQLLAPLEAQQHVCSSQCPLVYVDVVYVCLRSWSVHFCTPQSCTRAQEEEEGLICTLTGLAHEIDEPQPFVGQSFVAFGGQQQAAPASGPPAELMEATGLTRRRLPELEALPPKPNNLHNEREMVRHNHNSQAKLKICHDLVELLLFSRHREELNAWGKEHADKKTYGSMGKYLNNEKVTYHQDLCDIIFMDQRETQWCREMPQRDSQAAREAREACQAAVTWWFRFTEAQLTSQTRFEYHALAALYLYAKGTAGGEMARHPALLAALPSMNKLNRFPGIVLSTYTTHEQGFRDNLYLWKKAAK